MTNRNKAVSSVMHALEKEESSQRSLPEGSVPRDRMLLQIRPSTGALLEWLVTCAPSRGKILELGTSAGYSTLWILGGLQKDSRVLDTYDANPYKVERAAKTFMEARCQEKVRQHGKPGRADFLATSIAFCFLDTFKDSYLPLARLVVPCMVPGGLLAADNAISHRAELEGFLRWCHNHKKLDVVELPMDSGLLLARKR